MADKKKTDGEQLAEKLLSDHKHGGLTVSDKEM